MKHSLDLAAVWSDIRANYNVQFLEDLLALPGCETYIFGGTVRDTLLGRPWKDIDCRVVCPLPKEERNALVEEVLKRHGQMVFEVFFADGACKVYRFKIPGSRKIVVDFQITDSIESTPGDFRVCCIFYNLKTGEFTEQVPGCFDDFEKGHIHPTQPIEKLVDEPQLLLRSFKLACQTGFTHHPDFAAAIHEQKQLVRKHVEQVTGYIKQNGKDSFVEAMLGNFFSALKSDPKRYMTLLREFNLYQELCAALAALCGGDKTDFALPDGAGEKFVEGQTFEQRLSLFVSMIAESISTQPEEAFKKICAAFALDTDRSDGNEFVVNPREIVFVCT